MRRAVSYMLHYTEPQTEFRFHVTEQTAKDIESFASFASRLKLLQQKKQL
jgi:hypothetical protein